MMKDPNSIDNYPKRFLLTEDFKDPRSISYDIFGLFKKRTFSAGFLITVEYYKEYDSETQTYSRLVVKEDRTYNIAPVTLLVTTRDMTISWYDEDECVQVSKDTVKVYPVALAYKEAKSRRSNLTDDASMYLFSVLGQDNSVDFLNEVDSEVNLFIAGSMDPLKDTVESSTKTYMTATVKGTVLFILNQ